VLPGTSVVAATQNTVATVLRYHSMTRPPVIGVATFAKQRAGRRREPRLEQLLHRQIRTRRSETSVGQKYYYPGRI
jgi:hypothetical protein